MALVLPSLLLALAAQGDPAKDLRSKDFAVRLQAIEILAASGDDKEASKLLVASLKDDDWEVVEAAIDALGNVAGKGADKKLLDLALDAPLMRHRRAAARALATGYGAEAWIQLEKKMSSKTAVPAAQAAAAFGALAGQVDLDKLEKMLRSDEADEARAASAALAVLDGDRFARLTSLWPTADAWTRCDILDALHGTADASIADFVVKILAEEQLPDVVERRARWLAVDLGDQLGSAFTDALSAGAAVPGQARRLRLLGNLVSAKLIAPEAGLKMLEQAVQGARPAARAAAAHALIAISDGAKDELIDQSAALLIDWIASDPERQVRGTAIRSLARVRPASDAAVAEALAKVLANDESPRTREDAAVALAVKDLPIAVDALLKALADPEWTVRVSSAVSLGMTRDARAVEALAALMKNDDWKMRGAAVIGLQRSYEKAAIPPIIDALKDADSAVRKTAHETLMRISKQGFPAERDPWLSWWSQVERAIQLYDPGEIEARRKKYGYGSIEDQDTGSLFDGFDVVVLQSRGDHIENVLDKLQIGHRLTASSKVSEAELHPHAACVVNCTGEIMPADAERLAWFVRTGGYLLGSCWSLTMTINQVYPGVVQKLPTRGEVLDDVLAQPCAPDSPYLRGVFPEGCEPRYALEGAHLIQVLDPERCEVLVDSPECAASWGEGNLAVWFPAGHGLILDSVNHFEEQGLMRATYLKKNDERKAYAVDHMGLRYAELREIAGEKFWAKNSQAAQHVLDLSVFRIVSNFVREKRISADG
jgi:HEAT repeat protein